MEFILIFILIMLCLMLLLIMNNKEYISKFEFNKKSKNILTIATIIIVIIIFIVVMFEPFTSDASRTCMFQMMASDDSISRSEAKSWCNTIY